MLTYPPGLNLNGTNGQDLFEQYRVIWRALNEIEGLVSKAYPHGRDYQTKESGYYSNAREEYDKQVIALYDAKLFFHEMCLHIDAQIQERKR